MLEMSLNDDMIIYMPWNLCLYVRSMIFVEYNMMNIWICWWTPGAYIWFMIIWLSICHEIYVYMLDLWLLLNITWWTHDYVDEYLLYMYGLWWYECPMLKSYDDS